MTSNTDTTKVSYGSRGQTWAPEFISYMHLIVHHPNYAGMPDALKSDNKIQWEAPSNRSGGQFQFTHQKRRDWWEKKAKEIGIDTRTNQWISRVAKLIHPTGEKPCKRCGKTKTNCMHFFSNISLTNSPERNTVSGTGNCHFLAKLRLHALLPNSSIVFCLSGISLKKYLDLKFVSFIFCPIPKIPQLYP